MKPFGEIDFCLLIPCYNNYEGLVLSLKSVVYPTDNFLIVVIDDGSKEGVTLERINQGIGIKKPMIVLQNEKNLGITATLNKGLAWIEENTDTKYIARLDCGDICAAERFVMQVQYMDANSQIGLLGSWCQFQDKKTLEKYSYRTPVQHADIIKTMYFRNVFIHPTVMFRRTLLKQSGYYPGGFELAEDYAFFWKLIKIKQSFILDKFLVVCDLNKGGLSYSNKGKQLIARWRVVKTFGSNLALKITACARLIVLFILPKGIALQLKKWRK
ncbi:MAG TPA: glycosyltransferase [Chitinophagaceae bacterium]|nr:glycosyltransferase [Chitinophagaceae bacterium]